MHADRASQNTLQRDEKKRKLGMLSHQNSVRLLKLLFCNLLQQVVQLTTMLEALVVGEPDDSDVLECYFLEALYSSLGASLLDAGRIKFDESVKRISSMSTVHEENILAKPGELPGRTLPL